MTHYWSLLWIRLHEKTLWFDLRNKYIFCGLLLHYPLKYLIYSLLFYPISINVHTHTHFRRASFSIYFFLVKCLIFRRWIIRRWYAYYFVVIKYHNFTLIYNNFNLINYHFKVSCKLIIYLFPSDKHLSIK